MKDYLKNNRPTISLSLISLFFISNILAQFFDGLCQAILLFPQDIKNILTWYKLLTYPFYVGGLLEWLHSGIVIILAGYVIEHRLSKRKVIILIALSSILGGLVYSLINVNDPLNTAMASPTMISWGFASCAFVLILKKLRSSILFEKIVAGLFIVSLLSIDCNSYGFLAGQIGVIVLGLLYGLLFDEEKLPLRIGADAQLPLQKS